MKLRKILVIITVSFALAASAASPDFDRAFEDACLKLKLNRDQHTRGSIIPGLIDDLLRYGTKEDVVEAIARFWRDPTRKREWSSVLSLSNTLGPQTERKPIMQAIRESLPEVFKIGSPDVLLLATAGYMASYGSQEDIESLRSYLSEVRAKDPDLARGLEVTLTTGEASRKLQEKQQNTQPKASEVKPADAPTNPASAFKSTSSVQPSKAPEVNPAPPIKEQPASISWLVWGVMIVATIGLIWLVLKKRK